MGDASVGPCCANCGGGSCCPPDWYTLQGTRILSRSNLRKFTIALQAPATGHLRGHCRLHDLGDAVSRVQRSNHDIRRPRTEAYRSLFNNPSDVLNTKNFGLGIAAGYDVTIGHYFCRDRNNNDHFVEFTFWGLNSWSRLKSITGYLVPIYDEDQAYDASHRHS